MGWGHQWYAIGFFSGTIALFGICEWLPEGLEGNKNWEDCITSGWWDFNWVNVKWSEWYIVLNMNIIYQEIVARICVRESFESQHIP